MLHKQARIKSSDPHLALILRDSQGQLLPKDSKDIPPPLHREQKEEGKEKDRHRTRKGRGGDRGATEEQH